MQTQKQFTLAVRNIDTALLGFGMKKQKNCIS